MEKKAGRLLFCSDCAWCCEGKSNSGSQDIWKTLGRGMEERFPGACEVNEGTTIRDAFTLPRLPNATPGDARVEL
jgi:hypothetical protein